MEEKQIEMDKYHPRLKKKEMNNNSIQLVQLKEFRCHRKLK